MRDYAASQVSMGALSREIDPVAAVATHAAKNRIGMSLSELVFNTEVTSEASLRRQFSTKRSNFLDPRADSFRAIRFVNRDLVLLLGVISDASSLCKRSLARAKPLLKTHPFRIAGAVFNIGKDSQQSHCGNEEPVEDDIRPLHRK